MKPPAGSQVVIFVFGSILMIASGRRAGAEQAPTVFVLDTSDSDTPADSLTQQQQAQQTTTRAPPDELVNTKIIADESGGQSAQVKKQTSSPYEQKQPYQRPNKPPAPQHGGPANASSACTNPDHHQRDSPAAVHSSLNEGAPTVQSAGPGKHRDSSSRRNIDTESQLAPKSQRQPTNSYDGQQQTAAPQKKSQERLLISITSNSDDDSDHQQPLKAGATSGAPPGLQNDEPQPAYSTHNLQAQPHKRKPSITISIQDPSRPNDGSGGSPSVILRPGEDGQSIVISTVGGLGAASQQSQKYKPPSHGDISIPLSLGGGAGANQQEQPPYREPVNNPVQSIIQQHQRPPSTTRRPGPLDPYGPGANPSPIRLPPPPPQSTLTDEQPARPGATQDEPVLSTSQTYETSPRPHSKPPQQADYNNNEPGSSLDGAQGQAQHQQEQPNPANSKSKFPLNERNCGIMHETRIVGGEEADPDDFMWMVAIIKSKPRDGDPRPFCGGSLITRRHILTAAHCLEGLAPRDVLVRLGSYDFEDSASSSSADYAIDQFRVPAQYSKKTHAADIAIMRLKTPLQLTDNYKTVCMPQPRRSYVGALGTVTGYGSQSQTFRRAAPKLRQVTVPIWENRKCSLVYKKNLTESFLCAGYEEGGKDACQGDSGGPLMTDGPEQKLMIVGVVSHGIGCGAPGYPGVYTRTSTYLDWIEKNTRE